MDLLSTVPASSRGRYGLNSLADLNPELVIGLRGLKARVFFVNSAKPGGVAGNGASWDDAVLTLSAAIALAVADDVILVSPLHAESITAAATISFPSTKPGLSVIGLGNGSRRPTFTFTTVVTADIDIDAANITIANCIFDLTSLDNITAGIDVNAAGFRLQGCEVKLADAGAQAAIGLVYDDNCDGMAIVGCEFHGELDTTTGIAIDGAGADNVKILNNIFNGYFGVTGAIQQATTAGVNWVIDSNIFVNRTANADNKVVVLHSSTVAMISNNRVAVIDAISPAPFTVAAGFISGNYTTGAVGVTASVLA